MLIQYHVYAVFALQRSVGAMTMRGPKMAAFTELHARMLMCARVSYNPKSPMNVALPTLHGRTFQSWGSLSDITLLCTVERLYSRHLWKSMGQPHGSVLIREVSWVQGVLYIWGPLSLIKTVVVEMSNYTYVCVYVPYSLLRICLLNTWFHSIPHSIGCLLYINFYPLSLLACLHFYCVHTVSALKKMLFSSGKKNRFKSTLITTTFRTL